MRKFRLLAVTALALIGAAVGILGSALTADAAPAQTSATCRIPDNRSGGHKNPVVWGNYDRACISVFVHDPAGDPNGAWLNWHVQELADQPDDKGCVALYVRRPPSASWYLRGQDCSTDSHWSSGYVYVPGAGVGTSYDVRVIFGSGKTITYWGGSGYIQ